jgi:transposase-like protein
MEKRGICLKGLKRRRSWSEEDARRVLDAQEESGETIWAFARRRGLSAPRVYWWKRHLGQRSKTSLPAFASLVVREGTARIDDAVVVLVKGTFRLELRVLSDESARWMSVLVHELEEGRR